MLLNVLNTRFVDNRYEREEAFHSLQVTVKNCKLEDSLEQFVNGEILEGDNAYFCEKCNERVSMGNTNLRPARDFSKLLGELRERNTRARENCLLRGEKTQEKRPFVILCLVLDLY